MCAVHYGEQLSVTCTVVPECALALIACAVMCDMHVVCLIPWSNNRVVAAVNSSVNVLAGCNATQMAHRPSHAHCTQAPQR